MPYGPGDLDILADAFYGALEAVPADGRDPEEVKARVMTGILDAARLGERDKEKLTAFGLAAIEKNAGSDLGDIGDLHAPGMSMILLPPSQRT
jgi:hypothetical protein